MGYTIHFIVPSRIETALRRSGRMPDIEDTRYWFDVFLGEFIYDRLGRARTRVVTLLFEGAVQGWKGGEPYGPREELPFDRGSQLGFAGSLGASGTWFVTVRVLKGKPSL